MVYLVLFHVMVFVAIVASAMGAISILRGLNIFDLKSNSRNFLYLGSFCAICFGFLGATVCIESLLMTQWHYLAAALLGTLGVTATIHLCVDLSDRLSISARN
jgi:hypothetical protein